MVLAKSKNAVGLGNSLMNDRFGKGKGLDRKKATSGGIQRTNHTTGEKYVTSDRKEANWVKMRSITEQASLDEFLSTAELAGTDFAAEKMNNVKIIYTDQQNPYLLSAAEERDAVGKQKTHRDRLTVPKRPHWDGSTTPEELERLERESLLEWRRGLADLQENHDLLMTPFERNLEVWRQLWRVIERSDLVVQIVDSRNPLLFRSEDLEKYVKDVDPRKENLLLVNKADMMTKDQRQAWADYFEEAGIAYKFFSAHLAKETNEAANSRYESDNESKDSKENEGITLVEGTNMLDLQEKDSDNGEVYDENVHLEEERTRILTVNELEETFLQRAPEAHEEDSGSEHPRKIQVGLVGYPNVGKSSTINALIGSKKVSVSSTPGKTKHFQTIHLSERVILCDCPGLVFPNFATTKADLVCNGILPIDQLREFTGPASLVAERIPQNFLEEIYGMKIITKPNEEGGTGIPTGEEMLRAYAKARGFTRTGQGQPDESRAARYILKDYVNGKLLFCQPPPGNIDPFEFNRGLYDEHSVEKRRKAFLDDDSIHDGQLIPVSYVHQDLKSTKLDRAFFGQGQRNSGHLKMPFNYRYSEQGARQHSVDLKDPKTLTGKKHFKHGKRNGKRRTDYFAD